MKEMNENKDDYFEHNFNEDIHRDFKELDEMNNK